MSSEEKNKALVCRFMGAQAKGDLEALDELLAPDFVDHCPLPGQGPGREGFMQGVAEDHASFSDVRTTIEYQATDGEDMVITRHTTSGIHDRSAWLGIAPIEKERVYTGIVIHRISGGKILEEWSANSVSPILEDLRQEIRERERVEQEREMFGFPRLRALIAEHGQERLLGDFLLKELYSFVGEDWEQEDDITLLTLRRPAPLS